MTTYTKQRWIIELEPIQPAGNPERALALALKRLLRQDGLRCVRVRSAADVERVELVQQWRDTVLALDLASDDSERDHLQAEVRKLEREAMRLIVTEQEAS